MEHQKLDLGCGIKKQSGHIGIDLGDFSKDYPKDEFIQADVFEFIEGLEPCTIKNIYANQFIEHIPKDKFIGFINDCYRILEVGGILRVIFPPVITKVGMPNGEYYADPLHVNPILPGTFMCFSKEYRDKVYKELKTDYRGYGIEADLEVIRVNYLGVSQVDMSLKKI